jgi:hypothetical protein
MQKKKTSDVLVAARNLLDRADVLTGDRTST